MNFLLVFISTALLGSLGGAVAVAGLERKDSALVAVGVAVLIIAAVLFGALK